VDFSKDRYKKVAQLGRRGVKVKKRKTQNKHITVNEGRRKPKNPLNIVKEKRQKEM